MTIRTAADFQDAARMLNDTAKTLRKARRTVQEQERMGVRKPDRELLWRAEAAFEAAREEVQRFNKKRNRRDERPIFGGDEV